MFDHLPVPPHVWFGLMIAHVVLSGVAEFWLGVAEAFDKSDQSDA